MEPFQAQAVIAAPKLEQRTEGNGDVHQNDEGRNDGADRRQRDADAAILNGCTGAAGLAGQRGSRLGLQIVLLHQEQHQCDGQQHHSHRRCTGGIIAAAGNAQVDGGGQGIVGAADHHRVGEVCHGLDEGHQERVAKAGEHQRQRHRGEDLPAGGAHVAGGFLHRGIDVLQEAFEHHVADREEGQDLHDGDAAQTVDIAVIDLQKGAGDQATAAKEQDHRQGQHEGRRHHGQRRNHIEHLLHNAGADLHIAVHICEEETDQHRAEAGNEAQQQRVEEGVLERVVLEDAEKCVDRPIAAVDLHMGGGRIDGITVADGTAVLDIQIAVGRAQLVQSDYGFHISGADHLQALAAIQVVDLCLSREDAFQRYELCLPDMHAVRQQHGQGVKDEQRQQDNQCKDGGHHHRIGKEFLPFQRCALTGFHGHSPL